MLLNISVIILYSNTTFVKVKSIIINTIMNIGKNSNTTFVKVKLHKYFLQDNLLLNSNTTFVKVKYKAIKKNNDRGY